MNEGKEMMPKQVESLSVAMVKRLLILAVIAGAVGGVAGSYFWANASSSGVGSTTKSNKQLVVQESSAIINVAKKVAPSVVSIELKTIVNGFFGPQESRSSGTGIIISADGLIMTNRHVVGAVNAESYTVTMANGKVLKNARVIARDSFNDIAFMRVDDKGLPAAELGDSSALQIGQRVVAIGNALGRFQNTVTEGIVSGMGRPIEAGSASSTSGTEALTNLIQTDTAINSGNSGGPLVNLDGQVVGMNTAVASDAQNIGFSIPVNDAKPLIASVISTGKIVRPYLGVRFVTLTKDIAEANDLKTKEGAWLKGSVDASSVVSGSPAEKAGLKEGDVIVKFGGKEVTSASSLPSLVAGHKAGDRVEIEIVRDGKKQVLKATLEEAPKS